MSIPVTLSKRRYNDVEQDTPIEVDFPLHTSAELVVLYGEAGLAATLNEDYTILLNETDYSTFILTPLESLIDKIDAQIVAEPTDRNTILVRRVLPLTTTSSAAAARASDFTSREFDRITMKLQQMQEQLDRGFMVDVNDELTYDNLFPSWTSDNLIAWDATEKKLVNSGIAVASIEALGDLSSYVAQAEVAATTATTQAGIATAAASAASDDADDAVAAGIVAVDAKDDAEAAAAATAIDAAAALADRVLAQAARVGAELAETNAETAEDNAEAAAIVAVDAKDDAETAAALAQSLLDIFGDSWLGAHATPPTVDGDGGALDDGDLYWDTSLEKFGAYSVSGGVFVYLDSGGTAVLINYTPSGSLVAINVQDAIDELENEKFAKADVDTDNTLAADSDTKVASQKAVKAHIANAIAAVLGGVSSAFDTLAEIAAELALKATINNATFTGTFTPPDNTISLAKLANMATASILGRNTAGGGVPEVLSAATTKTLLSLNNVDNTSDATKNAATATLTNKRITARVTSITSSATPTVNTDNCDCVDITALAAAITSMTTNLSGTPTNFQKLIYRIKDNGTARAITWGASFEARGVALPTATVLSKVLTVGFIYDTTTSKWGCVASAQEA